MPPKVLPDGWIAFTSEPRRRNLDTALMTETSGSERLAAVRFFSRDNQLRAHKVPRVRACAMSHASRFPSDGGLCIVNSQDGIWPVQARLTPRPVRPLLPATVLKKTTSFSRPHALARSRPLLTFPPVPV